MKKKLNEAEVQNYFRQIVDAINYCHNQGVAHRDLSANNILFSNNEVLVADFGFASNCNDQLLEDWCGTFPYIAPEVIKKRPYNAKKADIWSLGILLFQMLHGYLPVSTPEDICYNTFECSSEISEEAQDLLKMILNPDTDKRASMDKIINHRWLNMNISPRIDVVPVSKPIICKQQSTSTSSSSPRRSQRSQLRAISEDDEEM